MFQKTGAGRGKTLKSGHGVALTNFDIQGTALKPEHKTFLLAQLGGGALSVLKSGGSATLFGLADRTGSDDYNIKISGQRVDAALAFLLESVGEGLNYKAASQPARGEAVAALKGDANDMRDDDMRAVIILVSPDSKPPPGPEPAPGAIVRTQDIHIKIFGFADASEQGIALSNTPEANALRAEVDGSANYLKFHMPLRTIWVSGGEGAKDRSNEIIHLVNVEAHKAKLGRIVIMGGSGGGAMVLKLAARLSRVGADLALVGISDGSFGEGDKVDRQQDNVHGNPLKFRAPHINSPRKLNFFQSWTNTISPPGQKLHGELEGFNNEDLFFLGSAVDGVRVMFEAFPLPVMSNSNLQGFINRAHEVAFDEGFRRIEPQAKQILKMVPQD